jgi:Zn-dependent peptidase ImmA (M78 family)/predicted secreted protein
MTSFSQRRAARLNGVRAATQQSMRLGLDLGEAVDVFRVIEQANVWLLFEPLDRLYGCFQRVGDAAGIMVHSGHPLSLQRFTGAHEYGHFVLGHEASQDGATELFGGDAPLQELEAQAFAAEFLMPLPLVNRALDRLGLGQDPGALSPVEAYQLSLELGSSYTATLTQLGQLNKITEHAQKELDGWQPISIKTELGDGTRPRNARAAVWDVTESRRDRRLRLQRDDELHVRLPELPSSGYRWDLRFGGLNDELELLVDELEPSRLEDTGRVGAMRRRHLWWRATGTGDGVLEARLVRSWEGPGATPIDSLTLSIAVAMPPTGPEVDIGIGLPQRRALLAAA